MNWYACLKRRVACFTPVVALLLMAVLMLPSVAHAEGGLAMSGSFYRQSFEIPQGSSVNVPSVYVVVFNNSGETMNIRMTGEAPVGVNLTMSDDNFTINPGEQQKVLIGVEVTEDAAPGEYTINVNAESYKEGVSGIQLMGAASQNAKLVVLGESASVKVQAVSPDGESVVAVVRLFKVKGDTEYEYAYSDSGILEANVSPGSFIASAYVGGNKLAEESFQVGANESKTITLTAATVYFEGFSLVPNYHADTGKLAFAEVVYTMNNLYQMFPEAEVVLKVSYEGTTEEEISLATLAPLEKGRVGLRYNYTPQGGWERGSYGFQLQLYVRGEVYTTTLEEALQVGEGSPTATGVSTAFNWPIIGGIAAGVVLLIIIVVLVRRRAY